MDKHIANISGRNNVILHQSKTGKHECGKRAAKSKISMKNKIKISKKRSLIILVCIQLMESLSRTYLFSPDEGSCHVASNQTLLHFYLFDSIHLECSHSPLTNTCLWCFLFKVLKMIFSYLVQITNLQIAFLMCAKHFII